MASIGGEYGYARLPVDRGKRAETPSISVSIIVARAPLTE